jgi:NitT/TauT family transport system permease protein
MTSATEAALPAAPAKRREGRALPLATVILALLAIWYGAAVWLNAPQIIDIAFRDKPNWTTRDLVEAAWSMERPLLPAPHQIAEEFYESVFERELDSRRSLAYHASVTASATLVGFAFGIILGVTLAIGIVHVRTLDRSLLPWIIASQTIPILAIAPMIIVVLGNIGFTGLLPKAIISMYLCFFPVTIGMVKGLRSPDPLQLDLMRTYSASPAQVLWKLRNPASVPFLFASLKVAIGISLVGAIVGELPTGAASGIGSRLLIGSYYSQTIQLFSALIAASVVAALLVTLVGLLDKIVLSRMGART